MKGGDGKKIIQDKHFDISYSDTDGDEMKITSNQELRNAYVDAAKMNNLLNIQINIPGVDASSLVKKFSKMKINNPQDGAD
jgi:hypothetical protein